MRNSYEVRAQKFIRELDKYITNCADAWDYDYAINKFMFDHPNRKVRFDHGLTRVAFITSDYVVKIDYNKQQIARFGGSENEIRFYEIAKQDGMEYLFAIISRYEYNGHKYYIMPKVTGINEERWQDAYFYMTEEEEDWCIKHQLYDLHCKNYGIMHGKVCIIDYGAYEDGINYSDSDSDSYDWDSDNNTSKSYE